MRPRRRCSATPSLPRPGSPSSWSSSRRRPEKVLRDTCLGQATTPAGVRPRAGRSASPRWPRASSPPGRAGCATTTRASPRPPGRQPSATRSPPFASRARSGSRCASRCGGRSPNPDWSDRYDNPRPAAPTGPRHGRLATAAVERGPRPARAASASTPGRTGRGRGSPRSTRPTHWMCTCRRRHRDRHGAAHPAHRGPLRRRPAGPLRADGALRQHRARPHRRP